MAVEPELGPGATKTVDGELDVDPDAEDGAPSSVVVGPSPIGLVDDPVDGACEAVEHAVSPTVATNAISRIRAFTDTTAPIAGCELGVRTVWKRLVDEYKRYA